MNNPTGWLLAMIKRARNGKLYATARLPERAWPVMTRQVPSPVTLVNPEEQASREYVNAVVVELRQEMARVRRKIS